MLHHARRQADQFADYFGSGTPLVEVPGIIHPVREMWLDELIRSTGHEIPSMSSRGGKGGKSDRGKGRGNAGFLFEPELGGVRGGGGGRLSSLDGDTMVAAVGSRSGDESSVDHRVSKSLSNWTGEHHIPELVSAALRYIVQSLIPSEEMSSSSSLRNTGVLVFLSGWDEIKAVMEELQKDPVLQGPLRVHCDVDSSSIGASNKVLLLPLHSALPAANHRAVFARPPPGLTKVVLSTNIAETSITIDDIGFVVDTGRAKEKTYDPVRCL